MCTWGPLTISASLVTVSRVAKAALRVVRPNNRDSRSHGVSQPLAHSKFFELLLKSTKMDPREVHDQIGLDLLRTKAFLVSLHLCT